MPKKIASGRQKTASVVDNSTIEKLAFRQAALDFHAWKSLNPESRKNEHAQCPLRRNYS